MATIYWRNASAYLQWSENGQQWRRSLGKIEPRAAEKIRAAKAAELTHGVRILPRLPTVDDFLDFYADWYQAEHPTTHRRLISELKPFRAAFGRRPIDTLRPAEIEHWKTTRLRTHAPETVGKELRRIKAAFHRGVQWQELDTNPAQHVNAPRGVADAAVVFYTAAAMQALFEANPRRAPLWSLAVNTGLRRGELAKATQADIATYRNGKRIRIESTPDETTGQGRTKSGRWREVPLNTAALEALAKLPERIAPVHPDTIGDWFAADAKLANIGGSLHRLRHTFCAHLAMAGVPLRRIQLLAGHADYRVTERYAHLSPTGAADAVDLLNFNTEISQR